MTPGGSPVGGTSGAGAPVLDPDSAQWLRSFTGTGVALRTAQQQLHELLLRIARREVRRRSGHLQIAGPELDDLANQAAGDAMIAITAKVDQFRGESRFTTWAYRFVILEVSSKIGRHFWRHPKVPMDSEDWDRLPDRFGLDPSSESEWGDLVNALRRAVDKVLTDHQRRIFVALVLNDTPLDALVVELGSNRNAIYKTLFDARRKLRAELVANGYLDNEKLGRTLNDRTALDRFLETDPRDVGCEEAMTLLHVYVEVVAAQPVEAEQRYPGIAAHLRACGPCSEDFEGLLDAIAGPAT